MSGHNNDDDRGGFGDEPPTMIDPTVPTGARERPAQFDPTARIEDHRRSVPPAQSGPFVPPVIPLAPQHEVPIKPARKAAGFDPHARIDDSSRTVKVEPDLSGSGSLRAISMKTPGLPRAQTEQRQLPKVKLRAMSEIGQVPAPGMGNLAPPRDPREPHRRDRRDHIIWASAAVIVASIVTLVIWFLARR